MKKEILLVFTLTILFAIGSTTKIFANEPADITIIMVSHDVKGVLSYGSHVLHLGERQLFFGTAEDYRKSALGKQFLSGGEEHV